MHKSVVAVGKNLFLFRSQLAARERYFKMFMIVIYDDFYQQRIRIGTHMKSTLACSATHTAQYITLYYSIVAVNTVWYNCMH